MKLKEFSGLTKQLFERPYKEMLFSVYNYADEERYIDTLKRLKYETDIDSLEFFVFNTDEIEDENILDDFKHYIEEEIQHGDVVVGILKINGKRETLICIKPKNVDINQIIKD